jgi:hypothetical protein
MTARDRLNCERLSASRGCIARGCDGKVRDVLFPVYDWFTEGFGTRDLI